MSEEEIKVNAEEIFEGAELEAAGVAEGDNDEPETEIRDTDIVFDCPHCGHNLAIDYRGAGLQITCVKCGETVLVPIPDGMKIDDLDIEPGEILKQLFAARRNLQKAELRIAQLEGDLENMADLAQKASALLDRMANNLNADMAGDEGGEDGEPST